jgi:hypothetical protein
MPPVYPLLRPSGIGPPGGRVLLGSKMAAAGMIASMEVSCTGTG